MGSIANTQITPGNLMCWVVRCIRVVYTEVSFTCKESIVFEFLYPLTHV